MHCECTESTLVVHSRCMVGAADSPLTYRHEQQPPGHSAPHSFTTRIDEPDHRFDVGVNLVEPVAHLANSAKPSLYLRKPVFDRGQPSRNVVVGTAHRLADMRDTLALQDRDEVLRVPPGLWTVLGACARSAGAALSCGKAHRPSLSRPASAQSTRSD